VFEDNTCHYQGSSRQYEIGLGEQIGKLQVWLLIDGLPAIFVGTERLGLMGRSEKGRPIQVTSASKNIAS
jgi:hypothetical protein